MNSVDYFFIFIFIANIVLYSWMYFRKGSGTAMGRLKYGERAALVTRIVFIILFFLTTASIIGIILGGL